MRASTVTALLLPALASAADVKLIGMGYRGGEAVKAGDELTLEITNSTEAGSGYPGKTVSHIRIVVWNSIYMSVMCSLSGILPAEDGNVTVTLPAEMGPSGMYYEIAAEGYESPTNDSWMNIIDGKNTPFFYFTGGKGSWTPAEVVPELRYDGLVGFGSADIPCKSYSCAQKCAAQNFPLSSGWDTDSEWVTCLSACEGVTLNSDRSVWSKRDGIQIPSSIATPSEECKEEDLETKCGENCCPSTDYCYAYDQCALLPLKLQDRPTSTGSGSGTPRQTSATMSSSAGLSQETGAANSTSTESSATNSSTAGSPRETGAANALGVNWKVIGAVAGVLGIVGAGI